MERIQARVSELQNENERLDSAQKELQASVKERDQIYKIRRMEEEGKVKEKEEEERKKMIKKRKSEIKSIPRKGRKEQSQADNPVDVLPLFPFYPVSIVHVFLLLVSSFPFLSSFFLSFLLFLWFGWLFCFAVEIDASEDVRASEQKMDTVVLRRRLMDLARHQADEIQLLQSELEQSRKRTFPSFQHIQVATNPDEREEADFDGEWAGAK